MRQFLADLHIHTALSPCAGDEMSPPAIVNAAGKMGLDIIAICDHNSSGNARACVRAAGNDLVVLAGVEITTVEEAHVLGIFPDADAAEGCSQRVLDTLAVKNGDRDGFGRQHLLDAAGNVVGCENRILSAAATFRLEQTVALIHRHDGLAIAAHVDRPSMSVMSQLGVFPAQAGFDAIEVADYDRPGAPADWNSLGLLVLHSSDSHYLSEIGTRFTRLRLCEASFEELRLAMARNIGGPPGHA